MKNEKYCNALSKVSNNFLFICQVFNFVWMILDVYGDNLDVLEFKYTAISSTSVSVVKNRL